MGALRPQRPKLRAHSRPGLAHLRRVVARGQRAIVALLAHRGLPKRYRGDTPGVRRDILWDGFTIINCPSRGCASTLGGTAGSIGLVVVDPVARARAAAEFLVARGFSAPVVTDAEPEIPICFVVTDALMGVALNFRKRALRFPHPLPLHG